MNIKKYSGEFKGYFIENECLKLEVLNYGAIIKSLKTKDKNGVFEEIILNFSDENDYITKTSYVGSIIGRVAGRISKGKFILNGKEYKLDINLGENSIHGGNKGLSKKFWEVKKLENELGLVFETESFDGESGFPGNLKIKVKYILRSSSLIIEYEAESDKETVISLTNHSYFNLSGNIKEKILENELFINSDEYIITKSGIPVKIDEVEGTPFDFRIPTLIKEKIFTDNSQLIENKNGYDTPFIVKDKKKPVIILSDYKSGRKMEVSTDQECVVVYTASKIREDYIFNKNIKGEKYLGICFETQNYPDYPNFSKKFPIYYGDKKYKQKTEFKFSIIGD